MIPDVRKCTPSQIILSGLAINCFGISFGSHLHFISSHCVHYSNDKNLCSKALLSGVQALSKADLQQQTEVNADVHHRYSQTSAYPHAAPVTPHHQGDIFYIEEY